MAKLLLREAEYHMLSEKIATEIEIKRAEVLQHYREMEVMRKMEIACDLLYKQKQIRGFCHLYDGQEAVAEGIEHGLTYEDPLIGAYRIHCQAYKRGFSVRQIVAEMLGRSTGATKGKGGSMHYYSKKNLFFGGNGIVGAQIPVGTGLAFALKYQSKSNVACIMFGDGAANQGQLYEAANMAQLWRLPALFVCENNLYGMGTSVERSSMTPYFYSRGGVIPGFRIQGNNVFEVKQAFQFAKNYALRFGPLFIEIMCYRYHGHSMSDPGVSYRNRDEVTNYRKTMDPLLTLRKIAVETKLATIEELDVHFCCSENRAISSRTREKRSGISSSRL